MRSRRSSTSRRHVNSKSDERRPITTPTHPTSLSVFFRMCKRNTYCTARYARCVGVDVSLYSPPAVKQLQLKCQGKCTTPCAAPRERSSANPGKWPSRPSRIPRRVPEAVLLGVSEDIWLAQDPHHPHITCHPLNIFVTQNPIVIPVVTRLASAKSCCPERAKACRFPSKN